MKRVMLCLLLFSAVASATAQERKPYQFPVLPGTEKWKKFQTHAEMLNACQLPAEYLKNSSTADLAQTCLNYPLFTDFLAYNSYQDGVNAIIGDFNGFRELLARKDNAQVLTDLYQQLPLGDRSVNQASLSFQLIGVECLLMHPDVTATASDELLKKLTEAAYTKLQERETVKDIAGPINKVSTAWLLGNLMKKTGTADQKAAGLEKVSPTDSRYLTEADADKIIDTYLQSRGK